MRKLEKSCFISKIVEENLIRGPAGPLCLVFAISVASHAQPGGLIIELFKITREQRLYIELEGIGT